MKAGWKTTEFWLALAPYILTLVVAIMFGVGLISEAAFTVIVSVLGGFGVWKGAEYTRGRTALKEQEVRAVIELAE